ncbi:hypothetical protein [Paracoccus hibiscisoli]|uniref:Porin family protein n=1 Tax=Paracoccus hibiscisoli TaxID=2023261 RepID=A0A4U0QEE1_9RHOB|nr:hypothetical protein [Paracoccus hibiscisoli]TJZ79861.1 hypothetical protein FA740_17820 [Paracoccus hibiscisoli]
MNLGLLFACGLLAVTTVSPAAAADGYFLQADIGGQTQGVVASASRGDLSFGLNLSDYEGGRLGTLNATYAFALPGTATLRAGPTIGFTRDDGGNRETEFGIRSSFDRWSATSFGSTYFLGEASTPQRSWFLLSQVTLAPSNIGIELSRGGSENYRETTLAVQRRVGAGPVSLRLGYKLSSEELFAGFSINTF